MPHMRFAMLQAWLSSQTAKVRAWNARMGFWLVATAHSRPTWFPGLAKKAGLRIKSAFQRARTKVSSMISGGKKPARPRRKKVQKATWVTSVVKWTFRVALATFLLALAVVIVPKIHIGSVSWSTTFIGVGAFAVVLLIAGALLLLQARFNKGKGGEEKDAPSGTSKSISKAENEEGRLRKWVKIWREHPLAYPVYIIAGWFAFTLVLWYFSEETAKFSWPGSGVSWWQWLRWDHHRLFWITPFFLLLGTWFALAKTKEVRAAGILIWIPLVVVWFVTLWDTTANSDLWHNVSDKVSSIHWGSEANASVAQARFEADQVHTYHVPVRPYQWSDPALVPTRMNQHLEYRPWDMSLHMKVRVTRIDGATGLFDDLPGNDYVPIGENIKTISFMVIGDKTTTVDVEVTPTK